LGRLDRENHKRRLDTIPKTLTTMEPNGLAISGPRKEKAEHNVLGRPGALHI